MRTWWVSLNDFTDWRLGSHASLGVLTMPTLFRFLTVVAVIGGLIYGGIYALANFVNPNPRDMTVNVPPDKFMKK